MKIISLSLELFIKSREVDLNEKLISSHGSAELILKFLEFDFDFNLFLIKNFPQLSLALEMF